MSNWWDYPVTQGHGVNGEEGVDFGTPIDTPVTSLFAGIVQSASYGPWGGLVTVAVPDAGGRGPLTEYALHLDQIKVKPGDVLTPGSLLGLSGGQLSGGQHPVTDPQYSSGPHLEYGFFQGAAFHSQALDPGPIIAAGVGDPTLVAFNPGDIIGGAAGAVGAGAKDIITNPGDIIMGPAGAVGGAVNGAAGAASSAATSAVNAAGHGIADALGVGVHDVDVFLKRQVIALFVAALVLLVVFKL